MQVECYDETGREVYDMILRQILQDVQIVRAVKDVRIYIDPRDPIFIIAIQYQKTAPPVLLDDFAEYKYDAEANEVFIRIEDENYLPELLKNSGKLREETKYTSPAGTRL
jgi:putative methanogenesis marker protein 17